jgi:carboxylate-amine ligase
VRTQYRTITTPRRAPDNRVESLASELEARREGRAAAALPSWARWNDSTKRQYTIGVEEEVMLVNSSDSSLAQSSNLVLGQLSEELSTHTSPETHAAVIELRTGIHGHAAGAAAELAELRARLARELRPLGLAAASAGTYPLACAGESRGYRSGRYRLVADSMRALARREPTLALHVHVGIPDPEDAVRLLNGIRAVVPILLALSGNSPFSQGRDSGFASARTVIFQGFPRTGTARWFSGYADYARAVDALIASGAVPDPSFLWWDVRLQPLLGTVEVRVMDAQTSVDDTAALITVVQSLARLVLEGDWTASRVAPEVLAENRFLAARDGLDGSLIDPVEGMLVPVRVLAESLLARCLAHAGPLSAVQREPVQQLAILNGAHRQRAWAGELGLPALVSALTDRFASPECLQPPLERSD